MKTLNRLLKVIFISGLLCSCTNHGATLPNGSSSQGNAPRCTCKDGECPADAQKCEAPTEENALGMKENKVASPEGETNKPAQAPHRCMCRDGAPCGCTDHECKCSKNGGCRCNTKTENP